MEDWIEKGEAAFAAGNISEAREYFEKALEREPLNVKIHNNLSVVHWKLGNIEICLDYLTRALEWDPNDQDVILNLSNIFHSLGKTDDAREVLNAYIERNPWDEEVKQQFEFLKHKSSQQKSVFDVAAFFTEQGELQFQRGRIDRAKACFEMALEYNPNCARAVSNLGVVWWSEGDLEKALELFHGALELDSKDSDIIYNSAKALTAAGELETAAEFLKIYLQQNPHAETAWQDYAALINEMTTATWRPDGLSKDVANIYVGMGQQLFHARDPLGATEAFGRALQLDPHRIEAYYHLGLLHLQLNQKPEAASILEEGLRVMPYHKESLLLLGETAMSEGTIDRVKALFKDYLVQKGEDDPEISAALERLSNGS
ncbi:MAG: tetratricopeptide repeat protein [Desulforhabdus sp.]|nr:tetratricopeptide repeat protein [Desulforhabdus sp.]